jgi:hypothetical protein
MVERLALGETWQHEARGQWMLLQVHDCLPWPALRLGGRSVVAPHPKHSPEGKETGAG